MRRLTIMMVLAFFYAPLLAQITPVTLSTENVVRCSTMDVMEEAIKKNPGIVDEWRREGEKRFQQFMQRKTHLRGQAGDSIVIPVVFHLVDEADKLAWITDRNLYDQLEIMNEAFSGKKTEKYKNVIPPEIFERGGSVPVKFVMARRTPDGQLTSGIERREHTSPDRKDIKLFAEGGLDAWDTDKYLNIWAGTFTGEDDNLLGVSTFPFTTTEGPQGVAVNIAALPFTSNVSRSYFANYSEGATVVHEVGHFFYLFHTFGDVDNCNNRDFRIQDGWPLPDDAGPDGDDTPEQRGADSYIFGNPSTNYSDGCTALSFGEMYGSFMNYFDDRSLFMFSQGYGRRIMACIDMYRPDLANSIGAIAPVNVNDAFVVSISPYGSPERNQPVLNQVPLKVKIRNYGNTMLNTTGLTVLMNGAEIYNQTVTVDLAPGTEKELTLGKINATDGRKILTVYTHDPNGVADQFPANDTLESFVDFRSLILEAPFLEDFQNPAFPPAGWDIWNPNGGSDKWNRSTLSGVGQPGSASLLFFNFLGSGQLDELIMPALDMGSSDSAELSYDYAYATQNLINVNTWDGLEIYLSNDLGANYQLVYKKTGNDLKTVSSPVTAPFDALPANQENWATAKINLKPYLNGNPLMIKFRGTNAKGNNLYIDNVQVKIFNAFDREVEMRTIEQLPAYICGDAPAPSVTFRNNGRDVLGNVNLNYSINNGNITTKEWTGELASNATTTFQLDKLPNQQPGDYLFKVYSSNPNGQTDEFAANDTVSTHFYVMGHATVPVDESFEGTFPPKQWVLQKSGQGLSWQTSNVAATERMTSVVMNNFNNDALGKSDNLISPVMSVTSNYDSLFLTLDYAYAPGNNYPAVAGSNQDTLDILLTMDCGNSFITLFSQYGDNLVTVENPASRKGVAFIPNEEDWKGLKFYLSPLTGNSDFQIFISSRGNHGNNIYVDNFRVFGVTVPQLLKDQGYLFYPSPFINQFMIRNFEQPVGMKAVRIYNSTGQLIWQQQFNGDAQKIIYVNTSTWARGIYTVRMFFDDRTVTDRVVKQ